MKIQRGEIVVVSILVGLAALMGYAYFRARPAGEPDVQFVPPTIETHPVWPAARDNMPHIEVSEMRHDFGTIEPDEVQEHAFTIRNTGSGTLHIEGLRTSCGCVSLEADAFEVAPGNETQLLAKLDPQHYGGLSPNIQVYIHTNDPDKKLTVLSVTAEITPECVVEPASVDFGAVAKGQGNSRTVRLRQTWREPVKVLAIKTSSDFIGASYSEVASSTDQDGASQKTEHEIEVQLKPDAPGGPLEAYVALLTDIKRTPHLKIPVRAFVKGGVYAVPKHFFFVARQQSSGSAGTIHIHADTRFAVTEAASDIEGISWQSKTAGLRQGHTIACIPDPGARPGERSGSVTVKLRQAGMDQITIPVAGLIVEEGS